MRIRADDGRSAAPSGQELEDERNRSETPPSRADRIRAARDSLEHESAPDYDEEPRTEEAPRARARRSLGEARREAKEVLTELDALERALASARSAASADPASPVNDPEPVCDPRGRKGRALFGEPSPYLEERMGGARSAAADLGRALDEIAARSGHLRTTVANLEDELTRASREIQFLRSDDPVPAPMPLPATPVGARQDTVARVRPKPVATAVKAGQRPAAPGAAEAGFAQYTTERYNRSVGVLANKRGQIGTTMLMLAAVISAVLLVITFLSHDPTPSIFVAGLPVIWMIPVPFFVVSFRGTQRVLRTNPMHLEGGF